MTIPTYTPEQEKALASHTWMTEKQAKYIFDLINTRVGIKAPTFPQWRARYNTIDSRPGFETVLTELKALPVLVGVLPPAAKDEGLYRDPNTGKLYRLANTKTGRLISEYSEVSRARRLLTTGETVRKGTWKRWAQMKSRWSLYPKLTSWYLLAEWFMTDDDKIEYVTGICNFCYRGLIDDRSVKANYGPDCAQQHGLPWGD